MRKGNNSLLHYLEQVCRNPYNLEPPRNAVEYLLRNGRAVVILDGIDELVDPELRRNVVQLVHGFAVQYPLVPILVTARRIGYLEAPLPIGMFTLGGIAELNDRQVRQYAENWFRIDVNTPDSESHRLAETFMSESKDISELRANPLLLALLCSMYSSEHYIPHNLAQIYEKCALMLFERWDKMRGIAMPMQFHGQLRGAVQYLAWQLASSNEPDKSFSNSAPGAPGF
jgi:predicted NACHT family NTPase